MAARDYKKPHYPKNLYNVYETNYSLLKRLLIPRISGIWEV